MRKRGQSSNYIDNEAAAFPSPTTSGQMRYGWTTPAPSEAGLYDGHFHCKDAAGKPVSFPNDGHIEIHVLERV